MRAYLLVLNVGNLGFLDLDLVVAEHLGAAFILIPTSFWKLLKSGSEQGRGETGLEYLQNLPTGYVPVDSDPSI
jgi:hypothetical protein